MEFKVNSWFTWTNFDLVRDSFGDLFSSWRAKVEQYGAGYNLYLAALRNPLPYVEHRFVNLVWALESLHRKRQSEVEERPKEIKRKERIDRILKKFTQPEESGDRDWLEGKLKYAHDPTLSERIVDFFSKLPISLDNKALRDFSDRCAKRRNDVSHVGGPREHEAYRDFHQDLSDLTDALSYLYHAFLLYEIGLDETILMSTLTEGGLAEMRLLPALQKVGLNIASKTAG